MTKSILTLTLIIASFLFISNRSIAQCDNSSIYPACMGLLKNFTYVKAISIDKDNFKDNKKDVEFSYVFSKGSTYLITICDKNEPNKKMIVKFFDAQDNMVTSSYNVKEKKHYLTITFPCSFTGLYKLRYSFLDNSPACGLSIIGVLKKTS